MLGRLALRVMIWRWQLAALILLHPVPFVLGTVLRIIK